MKSEFELFTDFDRGKEILERDIDEIRVDQKVLREHLDSDLRDLDLFIYRLEDMKSHNKYIDSLKDDPDLTIDESRDKYSETDLNEWNALILKVRERLDQMSDQLVELGQQKGDFEYIIKGFSDCKERFRKLVLDIDPEQKN